MTQEQDPLMRWAYIQSRLKESRRKVLEEEGFTESTLRTLEQQAATLVIDQIETQYGLVQKIPDKPVTYVLRRSVSHDNPMANFKHKLKLLERSDK